MPTIRRVLQIRQDPSKNPQGFLNEVNLAMAQLMEMLDKAEGRRGKPEIHSDLDMKANKIEFAGIDQIRRHPTTKRLQAWDSDAEEYRDITSVDEVQETELTLGDVTLNSATITGALVTGPESAVNLSGDAVVGGDGEKVSFHGKAAVAISSAYAVTNVTPDRDYDADASSTAELADVLGTLIADLQEKGLIGE